MTPAQYRLHRCATMRAAMRASAQFLTPATGVRSGRWPADLAGVSDRAPGAEPHDRAPTLMCESLKRQFIETVPGATSEQYAAAMRAIAKAAGV